MLVCRAEPDQDGSGVAREPACCRFAGWHRQPRCRTRTYGSDTTDAQWALIDPLLPDPKALAGKGGRPEQWCRRDIVDAIFYTVDNGNKWRALPVDFPPWKTVHGYLTAWEADGHTQRALDALRDRVRLTEGRTAEPTAAIIDSASVKAAETVGADTRGYDAGKKINGRKRHIAVDTMGLLLVVMVTAASVQDRDAGRNLLTKLTRAHQRIAHIWADGGYAGKLLTWAHTTLHTVVEVVKRTDNVKGFKVLPRRWVVERTFGWISNSRRCVRDYERLPAHHETIVRWSHIHTLSNRLAKQRV